MTNQLQESLTILCDALGCEALPVADHVMVEAWLALPGFTPARLRRLVAEQQQRGRKISSARYFDPIVRETFALTIVSRETEPRRPRLLSERPWNEYLAVQATAYGSIDDRLREELRYRWETERAAFGRSLEETDENGCAVPELHPGAEPRLDPLPFAA